MPTFLPLLRSAALTALFAVGAAAHGAAPAASTNAATPASQAASAPNDPYLWLEQVDSPQAMAWVRAENDKTLSVLESDPRFDAFHRQALVIAQSRDRIAAPSQLDGRIYNFWQDPDHVRGIWRQTTQRAFDAAGSPHWQTVLDLDQLSAAEHANWVWEGARCDAQRESRCLLSLSDGGEDAVTVREFDLRQAAFVGGGFELPKGKVRVAWQDADTLLVSREWAPGELTTSGYPYVVKSLRRGQPLSEAKEVFRGTASDGGYGVGPQTLTDAAGHRALIIERSISTFESEHYIVTANGVQRLGLPAKSDVMELYDGQLLVKVNEPWAVDGQTIGLGTLVALDLAQVRAAPQALRPTIVLAPNARQSIAAVSGTKTALIVTLLDNVRGRATLHTRRADGTWTSAPIALPDNATVRIADTSEHTTTAYLSVTGYLQPSSLWRAESAAMSTPTRVRSLPPQFDASRVAVEQRVATSSDGTHIPYFIVHPKEMALDGGNPTVLYAYGGFDVSISPNYNGIMGKLWLEHGGVYVVANIRGGGEFGPAWHEAGLKTKRQLIYDDFAAVARDLIAAKVTSPRRLGIMGGSNGGLLMGVQMTQHPELWNAVDIQVPLLDMLRYEQIAAGPSWVGEYGSVSVPEERAFLAAISPYNNIHPGTTYPRPLIWTTTKDDRVGPQHARKFAARLAEYGVPYYFYEVVEGGHGAGANLKERAHTSAIEFTYFSRQLMDR